MMFELIWGCGLNSFAALHPDDFLADDRWNRYLAFVTKLMYSLTQLSYFLSVIALINLVYAYFENKKSCAGATLTTQGTPFLYFTHVGWYIVATTVLLSVTLYTGTRTREECVMRGELYKPSNDNEIRVPWGLDCRKQREAGNRVCVSFFGKLNEPSEKDRLWKKLLRPFSRLAEASTNCFFYFCCRPCGVCMEQSYKHRHFIGP